MGGRLPEGHITDLRIKGMEKMQQKTEKNGGLF